MSIVCTLVQNVFSALDSFKLLIIITFQEEQTLNSDEERVEVKQRSCKAGQDNGPEIQDDSGRGEQHSLAHAPSLRPLSGIRGTQ